MAKLWHKKPDDRQANQLAAFTEAFTVGRDYLLDMTLLPYDVKGSIAHVRGLVEAELLEKSEGQQLIQVLETIPELVENGKFSIQRHQEDGHTAIEAYLIAQLGELGKKIHTGRSRNDQVLTAMRLYEKDQLIVLRKKVYLMVQALLKFARQHEWVAMPGYSHTQPAMVASVGMWAGSYAELLLQVLHLVSGAEQLIDYCPLGTAAGYGTNLPLPREQVAKWLGFAAPMTLSMSAQSSRGRWEAAIVHALSQVGGILSQLASDFIQFASREYNFFNVDEALTTGSSIMPQKKNWDVAELLRARQAQLLADEQQLHQLTYRLTSGYHRDLQLTKEPVLRSFTTCLQMLEAGRLLVTHVQVNEKELAKRIYPELMAADAANELVRKGIPFREAYRQIADELETLTVGDLKNLLQSRTHLGATGNLGLEQLEATLKKHLNDLSG